MLKIENLGVETEGRAIIKGLGLALNDGEVHVLMGPNGSGKTTLAYAIAGHPKYKSKGRITLDGADISSASADERARKGIFLAFQNPPAIEGVGLVNFIRKARSAKSKSEDIAKLIENVGKDAKRIDFDEGMLARDLNVGLSGGEKKKSEILQMLALSPRIVILDEIDSGLDVDSLKLVAKAIENAKDGKRMFLVITHHADILKYVKPDFVHIMIDGRITKSGTGKLAKEIERKGYEWLKEKD